MRKEEMKKNLSDHHQRLARDVLVTKLLALIGIVFALLFLISLIHGF